MGLLCWPLQAVPTHACHVQALHVLLTLLIAEVANLRVVLAGLSPVLAFGHGLTLS
jgi:hypothetical protein